MEKEKEKREGGREEVGLVGKQGGLGFIEVGDLNYGLQISERG